MTDILLFEWDDKAVERMAGNTYPALAAAWRSLTLYAIGSAFSSTCGEVRSAANPKAGRSKGGFGLHMSSL